LSGVKYPKIGVPTRSGTVRSGDGYRNPHGTTPETTTGEPLPMSMDSVYERDDATIGAAEDAAVMTA
jgi:hypothetical protein